MPLVTLTCSKMYYPPDDDIVPPTANQQKVIDLANDLPQLIIDQSEPLGIGDVPPEAVQVDIKKFHARGVNTVDFWAHVWLTETPDSDEDRYRVRDTLRGLLKDWLKAHGLKLEIALDVFFGPGVGAIIGRDGETVIDW